MSVIKLSREDLIGKKIAIIGLTGTGKTTLAKYISRKFATLVYTPHIARVGEEIKTEWDDEDVMVFLWEDFYNDFSLACKFVKEKALERKLEMFVIDEFDLLYRNNFEVSKEFLDLSINHRHYNNLSIVGITRRPQNIPTTFFEECHILFIFTTEAPNVVQKLNNIYPKLGDMARNLKKHEFIVKIAGKEPFVSEPIRL